MLVDKVEVGTNISAWQIIEIMPECEHVIVKYIEPLNEALGKFGINTPLRQAAFLSHVGHESIRFTRIEENLNYSANGLLRTWPDYFTPEQAKEFAYKPQRIANRVYAHKGGNGDESSGDGWRFRGRGLLPIMLRRGYSSAGFRLTGDSQTFIVDPDLLLKPEWAVKTACDLWVWNELNVYADRNSAQEFRNMTRKVNRGLRGLDDRLDLWRKAKQVLGAPEEPELAATGTLSSR